MREPKITRVIFNFHSELCSGCGACIGACMDENNTVFTGCPVLRTVQKIEERNAKNISIRWYSYACIHCAEHPCIDACPKRCFSADSETGTVQLDNTGCIGCRSCERVCSYKGIVFDTNGKASKCSGCLERLKEGKLPRCVEACPCAAITIDDRPAVRTKSLAELREALKSGKLRAL